MSHNQSKRFRLTSSFYRRVKMRSNLEKSPTRNKDSHGSTSKDLSHNSNLENMQHHVPSTSSEHKMDFGTALTSCVETKNYDIDYSVASDCETNEENSAELSNDSPTQLVIADDNIISNADTLDQAITIYNDNDGESSDSSIVDQDDDKYISFQSKIQQWALQHQVRHNALNELLGLLRDMPNMNFLPKDSRSLLKTPRTNNIVSMGSGKYWYNGIRDFMNQFYSEKQKQLPTILYLTFNIDGLPIAKSSKDQFWPILCKTNERDMLPFVVAIYHGSTKPPINDFLQPFVDELLILIRDGVLIENNIVEVKIRCFICDTPARCFVKGTMGFNSYHGCMKCTIIGEYDRKYRHMSFPRTDLPLRTDSAFRNRIDSDHHKERTVIETLPIDLVQDFPIADALHLLDLGVMKRCLVGWTSGNFNFDTKWSAKDIKEISKRITDIKSLTPKEIHQGRMRDLESLHFWKGTELKNFLLYFGIVILKDYLSFEVYQHFITLFCAVTICYNDAYKSYWHIAQQLFEDYIEKFAEIYGQDSVGSNIHNLCHIVNDVTRFGSLPSLSAYPFESMLFKIKNLLRKGDLPLSQVANRLQELTNLDIQAKALVAYPVVKHKRKLENNETVFSTVVINQNITLSSKENKDKWFLSKDNNIIEMEYAILIQGEVKILGKSIKEKFNFFQKPLKSSHINVYATARDYDTEESKTYELQYIKCKLLSLIYHNQKIFIPILSTL